MPLTIESVSDPCHAECHTCPAKQRRIGEAIADAQRRNIILPDTIQVVVMCDDRTIMPRGCARMTVELHDSDEPVYMGFPAQEHCPWREEEAKRDFQE